jgi:hypothetical protein
MGNKTSKKWNDLVVDVYSLFKEDSNDSKKIERI